MLARMSTVEYRAEFDATVAFGNGGGLRAEAFRVDVPGPDTTEQQVAELFVASINLLMVERVDLHGLRLFPEPHKGTHKGPSDLAQTATTVETGRRWVELSHLIVAGMITYPGLPGPPRDCGVRSRPARRPVLCRGNPGSDDSRGRACVSPQGEGRVT